MHRQMRPALFQRRLQLLDEQALAADLGQRPIEDLVAAGGHAQQADAPAEALLQQGLDMFGLPHRQTAFSGGDQDLWQHLWHGGPIIARGLDGHAQVPSHAGHPESQHALSHRYRHGGPKAWHRAPGRCTTPRGQRSGRQ